MTAKSGSLWTHYIAHFSREVPLDSKYETIHYSKQPWPQMLHILLHGYLADLSLVIVLNTLFLMFIREFRLHLLLEYNAACTCGISRRLPITPITLDSSVGTSIPSLTHRQQYITISFSLCQYYGIIFCIFSNKSDRFGNVNFQPQGKHMTLLIQLHTLKCQLIHLLQS